MLNSFIVKSAEIDDKFIVPYYKVKILLNKLAKKYKMLTLGEVSDYCISGSYIPQYSKEGDIYIRVQNIRNFDVSLNEDDIVFINPKAIKIPDKIRVKTGDMVLVRTTISLSNFGNTAIISSHLNNSIISQHVTKLSVTKLNPYFVACFLNSKLGKDQLVSAGYGSTRLELTHAQLKKVLVPIVSNQLQNKIGKIVLDAEDKHVKSLRFITTAKNMLLDALGIKINTLRKYKHYSVVSNKLEDMLTPKYYYPFFIQVIANIEKKFRTVDLGNIAEISRGIEVGSENYRIYLEKKDTDVPFIRTSDIINNEIDNSPDYYVGEEIYNELNLDIKENDILFTKDGKIGLVALTTKADRCIIASGIAKIRIKRNDPYFVFAVLNSFIGKFQAEQRTVISSTLPHLRPERLAEIRIPIISKANQKEISQLVKEAFELKRQKKELIKEAKEKIEEIFK
jgi:type I restriction enzyme S subunit